MLIINKRVGETPLEALNRLRTKNRKYKKLKLSYIGRLDPMAEGKILVLVGDKENKEREKYLHTDKEYKASFLLGVKTDSNDILGLITNISKTYNFNCDEIRKAVLSLEGIKKQKYPWFSGKTINGIKMFDIYKKGNTENVRRPVQNVRINILSKVHFFYLNKSILKKYILNNIEKVNGDFRQDEIKTLWQEFFANTYCKKFLLFSFSLRVSSGTFIRELVENLSKKIKKPIILYKLKRTKIFL